MAKSIRSKEKNRLRSVKRAVIKKQRTDPESKLGEGGARSRALLKEAATGHIAPRAPRPGARARTHAMARATRHWHALRPAHSTARAAVYGLALRRAPRRQRPRTSSPYPYSPGRPQRRS